jgi:hypothetical protein
MKTARGTRYAQEWTRNHQLKRVYTYTIWYGSGEDDCVTVVLKPENWLSDAEINAIADYWLWHHKKARKVRHGKTTG